MKATILCERTVVQENENFATLKEERINEESRENAEEKKTCNGIPDSTSEVDNFQKDGMSFQNGGKPSKTSSEEWLSEDKEQKQKTLTERDIKKSENYLTGETDSSGEFARKNLCSDRVEVDCENVSSENKIIENLEAENSSEINESSNVKSDLNSTVEVSETDDDDDENGAAKSEGRLENLSLEEEGGKKKGFGTDEIEEKEGAKSGRMEVVQPIEGIILDTDENKENEKDEKTDSLEDYSVNELNKLSDECEIQVGEVQTISGAEKDSLWTENDLKKCEEDLKEKLEEKLIYECQDMNTNEDGGLGGGDSVISEAEENPGEDMHIEVDELEQVEELKAEEKESNVIGLESLSVKQDVVDCEKKDENVSQKKTEGVVRRKRQVSKDIDVDLCAKKKRLAEVVEEAGQTHSEEENAEDSFSFCESIASLETAGALPKGVQALPEGKMSTPKTALTGDKNDKELNPSEEDKEADGKKSETTGAVLSALEKFRGTLKTLTRSDLEELIVQKLCEVITERSNVGELRRKAQALEQDQERWKAKAQSLNKQMREMEMVMKKYMTEVQKQIKEGDCHVVTPLKVTRSVGLQVSFFSSANKGPKPNLSLTIPPNVTQNVNVNVNVNAIANANPNANANSNTRNTKAIQSKLPPQYSSANQNVRNKPLSSFQKGSPSLQKPPANQIRRSTVPPKPDYPSTPTSRPAVQQSPVNNTRAAPIQAQGPRLNYKPISGVSPQLSQNPHHNQQQQHQQQNGSKVIDLTDDDDRQMGNFLVKAPGSIRVVNHLPQQPPAQNNRLAYLLPTTSVSTGNSPGQSRQVLIATPTVPQTNRQIMCSMPPLLFKGGNSIQSGPQPQMLNPSNKVLLPKFLRHPAPLPKRPITQNTRPNLKLLPPRPALKISKVQTGIVLSWNMALSQEHAPIASYQLYAYQESDSPPATSLWKKVGDVKALPLPMACTLTQFMSGHKYHFAVRAVDLHSRVGPFSFPGTIVLV